MANYSIKQTTLTKIANALRVKGLTEGPIKTKDIADAILSAKVFNPNNEATATIPTVTSSNAESEFCIPPTMSSASVIIVS